MLILFITNVLNVILSSRDVITIHSPRPVFLCRTDVITFLKQFLIESI